MRDYYPLLSRIVAGLDTNTGEARRALYGRARVALCEQLRKREPRLTDSEITHERLALEAAIRKFEAATIRRPRQPPASEAVAASVNVADIGRLDIGAPAEARAEPVLAPPTARPGEQRLAPQLVELALLARVVEAKEQRIRPAARAGQGGNARAAAGPRRAAPAGQRTPPPQQAQEMPAAQDLLTRLIEARQEIRLEHDTGMNPRIGTRSLPDMPRSGDFITPLLAALYFVLGFAQLVAFFHGLQTAFGLGGVTSIGIFMLLYSTGSLGSIPMAIISFYGAWRGWQWPIWDAALFAFPFVILSFGFLGIGGFYSFFNRRKTPPLVRFIRSLSTCALARGWRAARTTIRGRARRPHP